VFFIGAGRGIFACGEDFLEKALDKSALNCPVATHIIPPIDRSGLSY